MKRNKTIVVLEYAFALLVLIVLAIVVRVALAFDMAVEVAAPLIAIALFNEWSMSARISRAVSKKWKG